MRSPERLGSHDFEAGSSPGPHGGAGRCFAASGAGVSSATSAKISRSCRVAVTPFLRLLVDPLGVRASDQGSSPAHPFVQNQVRGSASSLFLIAPLPDEKAPQGV